jgi:CheY-like chemotaxis protein
MTHNYLIIEDDAVQHVIYKRKFAGYTQLQDYVAHSCFTYAEAIKYIDGLTALNRPDFIILDINLDMGHTGWEFLQSESFKPLSETAKVFVCTSSISNADKAFAMQFPCVKGYLVKPIDQKSIDFISSQVSYDI